MSFNFKLKWRNYELQKRRQIDSCMLHVYCSKLSDENDIKYTLPLCEVVIRTE